MWLHWRPPFFHLAIHEDIDGKDKDAIYTLKNNIQMYDGVGTTQSCPISEVHSKLQNQHQFSTHATLIVKIGVCHIDCFSKKYMRVIWD